ncbi:MAG: hypothetical protein ACKO13_00960, partial [Cytophagales bacterium]
AQYAKNLNTQDFTVYELVSGNRKLEQMKMAADFLAQKGMILYDGRTGKIHVKNKAIHLWDVEKLKADYDNMKIQSLADTVANAIISLKKRQMLVHGVEEFNLSDSLNVVIKPDSAEITLLQNRDIKFNGSITAGNFEICGKDFVFNYEGFFVDLNHIDSIRLYITEKDGSRRRVNNSMMVADSAAIASIGLKSNANKTSGKLFINRPDNKSGRNKEPNFPRLNATEGGGVIYFDRQEILDGAYDKSVFFVMPTFSLDSLDDANPNSMNFDGTFVSSGIFPNFKEKIHTIGNGSMGLTHQIPSGGYRLFRTDATLQGNIKLDNEGIRANGKIEYMAAEVKSNDFVFYLDSVLAKGNEAIIREKQIGSVRFPKMQVSDYQMKWFPKQDRFRMKNLKEPFAFYDNTASLNGIVTVTKAGTFGSGKLTTLGSVISSREFNFNSRDFRARHARFEVKTGNPDKPALFGRDINLKFDLDRNFVNISPEVKGVAAFEFPYIEFTTSIPNARWDLATQKIVMTKSADVPLENSYFYTTRQELDSLHFNAEKAEYDLQKQELKVSGIPHIVVADAKITPDKNEILILQNAKIGQLKNTTIVIDTLNGYHLLTNGVVDIVSRKEFTGYANYKYINAANDTFTIKMTGFHLEPISHEGKKQKKEPTTQQTVASGQVAASDKILVAPRIFYKGDMTMYGTRPALQLNGFVKLDLKKIKNYNTWLTYRQSGDEKDIYLDFDNATTEDGEKAMAGLHFAQDNRLYITFVSKKKDEGDEDFFLPSGSLFFDKESSHFKIEDRKKAGGEKLEGKVFAYNEDKQEVVFEGPVKFFGSLRNFSLTSSAIGSGSLETNEIKMNSLIQADIGIPPVAYQTMALNLQEVIKNEGASEGLGDQTELLYKMANIVGERITKEYETRAQQGYVSLGTVPGMIKPIVFSNVNLKWSQDKKAFYSEGQLGISNIDRFDINGAFEGFMEIRKSEDGSPVFHVFFKASPEAWYYFGFEDNRLMVHSSNQAFNEIINKKTNAAKAKIGELVYVPGSDDETLSFVNRFRLNYYGIEAPYDLAGGTSVAKKKDKKKEEKKEDDGF